MFDFAYIIIQSVAAAVFVILVPVAVSLIVVSFKGDSHE